MRVFSCDADDHVDELGGTEGLADEWADADELGVVFGVFDGDLGGERHGDTVSEKIFAGDGKWTRRGTEILCRAYALVIYFTGVAAMPNTSRGASKTRPRSPPHSPPHSSPGRPPRNKSRARREIHSRAERFDDRRVTRIWGLGGRGLCRLGLCRRWSCLRGGRGRL